jgi:hypothetical protein
LGGGLAREEGEICGVRGGFAWTLFSQRIQSMHTTCSAGEWVWCMAQRLGGVPLQIVRRSLQEAACLGGSLTATVVAKPPPLMEVWGYASEVWGGSHMPGRVRSVPAGPFPAPMELSSSRGKNEYVKILSRASQKSQEFVKILSRAYSKSREFVKILSRAW